MLGTRRILEELVDLRRESVTQHAETQTLNEDLHRRYEDDRRVNREILRRNEIVMRQVVDALDRFKDEFKEESRQTREASREAAKQTREASEAHTRAIFALIDRLGNGPRPASGSA